MPTVKQVLVGVVDLTKIPNIYRTNNPAYYGKFCIDFFPDAIPTIAPFDDLEAVKSFISETFGRKQFNTWFPHGISVNIGGIYQTVYPWNET